MMGGHHCDIPGCGRAFDDPDELDAHYYRVHGTSLADFGAPTAGPGPNSGGSA